MRSSKELVHELRSAPGSWIDAAIVVAFEDRFEFVAENHPDPAARLNALERQGGLAIGLAGIQPTASNDRAFLAQIFKEYKDQAWAHRYMDTLRRMIGCLSSK